MQTNSCWFYVILIVFAPLKTMLGCKGEQKGQQVNLTNSIDTLIPYISKYIVDSKMDPLKIPDVHQRFCVTDLLFFPLPICIGLTYSLSSGLLHYLSQIKRRGPVIITSKDGVLDVDASLTFDKISVSYNYFLESLILQQHGKSVIEGDSIWANIGLAVNTTSCKFAFKRFKLMSVKSIQVIIKEDGLINQLIMFIANIVVFLMKNTLIESIESGSTTALREAFKGMNEAPCPWNPINLVLAMFNLLHNIG
ncbi:uncharacterized protein LOC108632075 [Ceratina calcarata]|uniref:Uncharacterized protein LOC108632075 n=1 Tax=Ceratina calcarata TaxID=156304 RepID=A0AAJ7NEX9_9HYME|nr:uncharacterized protein LOC108632075 [Ceratina calcarata]